MRYLLGMNNATETLFSRIDSTVTAAGASAHISQTGPNAVKDLLVSGPSANVLRAVAALGLSRGNRREKPANKLFGAAVRYDLSDIDGRKVGEAMVSDEGGSATVWGAFANVPKCIAA